MGLLNLAFVRTSLFNMRSASPNERQAEPHERFHPRERHLLELVHQLT
jgi:hypothetical protein